MSRGIATICLCALTLSVAARTSHADVKVTMTSGWDLLVESDYENYDDQDDIEIFEENGRIVVQSDATGVLVNGQYRERCDFPADDLIVNVRGRVSIEGIDLRGYGDDLRIVARPVSMSNCRSGQLSHSDIVVNGGVLGDVRAERDIVVNGDVILGDCHAGRDLLVEASELIIQQSSAVGDIVLGPMVGSANYYRVPLPVAFDLRDTVCVGDLLISGSDRYDYGGRTGVVSYGNDTIELSGIHVLGGIEINTYGGGDQVTLDSIYNGSVTVKLGSENDTLRLENITTDGALLFDGGTGRGDKLYRTPNDRVTAAAAISAFESFDTLR